MTRVQKAELIDFLSTEFKASEAVVVCDYKGLTVKELEELRNSAREVGVKVQVVKNTLAKISMETAGLETVEMTDMNLVVWGEEQIATCKVASKFADSIKDRFNIKAGILEGKAADVATVEAMAKLPGREELLGMLASVWMGPVRNFTIGLDALRIKKEEEAA
jgi:large subunit ribosomal protein L10